MWVDLTASVRQAELPGFLTDVFDVVRPHDGNSLEAEIRRQQPRILLFDFDYPERPGLKLLERTKQQFPGTIVLMMTLQHSESLAVWAFRTRVWDYLVKPVSNPEARRLLAALHELFENIDERRALRVIHSKSSPLPKESRVSPRSSTPAELMPALAYIEQHFHERVTSENVSKACSMDSFQFSRAFKASFGITFKEYLLRVRIKEACRLLEKPDITVTDVAYLTGFNDPSYFSKVFKRYADVSPSEFASSSDNRSILNDDRLALIL
jgi:YesN/AraC family two-component response regulator